MEVIFMMLLVVCAAESSQPSEVKLLHKYLPNGHVLIQCKAAGENAGHNVIQLGCSTNANRVCMENCTQRCRIINGKSNCSDMEKHAIKSCTYTKTSANSFNVDYEIGNLEQSANYWCKFRGSSSKTFDLSIYKAYQVTGTILEETSNSRKMSQRSIKDENVDTIAKENEKDNLLTPEVVFIVTVCTIASLLFNIIFLIRCQMTKKYIDRLASGGPNKPTLERLLCLKTVAKTYTRKAPVMKTSNLLRTEQGYMRPSIAPFTDPMPRRVPLQMNSMNGLDRQQLQSSFNHIAINQPIFRDSRRMSEDLVYDDVNMSSACQTEINMICNRSMAPDVMPQTPQSARKCLVDQDGTVYVAMGQVSSDGDGGAGMSFGSKATLNSVGNIFSPRSPQPLRGSRTHLIPRSPEIPGRLQANPNGLGNTIPARLRSGQGMPPIFPTNGNSLVSRLPGVNYSPRIQRKNQELDRLPEEGKQEGVQSKRKVTAVPTSHLSSRISAPIPFADDRQSVEEQNEFDDTDPFEMGQNTLLSQKRKDPASGRTFD